MPQEPERRGTATGIQRTARGCGQPWQNVTAAQELQAHTIPVADRHKLVRAWLSTEADQTFWEQVVGGDRTMRGKTDHRHRTSPRHHTSANTSGNGNPEPCWRTHVHNAANRAAGPHNNALLIPSPPIDNCK